MKTEPLSEHRRTRLGIRYGEEQPNAKLTDAKVREIRRRLEDGERVMDLVDEFRIARSTISHVKSVRHWSHVTNES